MESVQTELNLNGLTFPNHESKLTKLEKEVYDLIPTGKENSVTSDDIANVLGIDPRYVKKLVQKMRLKYYGIGSDKGIDSGYYLFKNHAEYQEFISKLEMEQMNRQKVIDALKHSNMAQEITAESEKTA